MKRDIGVRISRRGASVHALRSILLKGASGAVLAGAMVSAPAHAQLAGVRAAVGVPANVGAPVPAASTATAVTPTMSQIMARHRAYEARVSQAVNVVAQANAAARAAANAAAQVVPNGLGAGGLDPVAQPLSPAEDATGLRVWVGAAQPVQTQNAGSAVTVTVNQTQSRALLSWNSFNVGAQTTLAFNQQGQSDWVVVNRVVGGIDPATGLLDPSLGATPSQIFGSIKADGSVYVLNRAGVMFGANAQLDLRSLLASSLELGSATVPSGADQVRALSLRERNQSYLDKGLLPEAVSGLVSAVAGEQHGAVDVARGARITAKGGYVIIAAPTVSSAGEIKATVGGQVSLQAGNQVDATVSTGAAGSDDPGVRGLILSSLGGGQVNVTGSIDAPQGYISLGTDLTGSIRLAGTLTSTTSVSRNGKISLIGGTVDLAPGAAIAITPDTAAETIPQSASSVSAFKTSQIDIGSHFYARSAQGRIGGSDEIDPFELLPAQITIGRDAIIHAPSADVAIGGRAGDASRIAGEVLGLVSSKVDVQDNAVINVSGVADLLLPSSRNVLEISPAKRNELRDTPNYREETTDGSFTLNGTTLFVDPRISGVRDDGVAWVGSPLLEAGSLAEQIGVTAQELMTTGGNVTLATLGFDGLPTSAGAVPSVTLAPTATVDVSGGWVRYAAGIAHYSKLVTSDGRVIDIAKADPNDDFVAVGDGFVEFLPQLSLPTIFANPLLQGGTFQQGYVEGRDAGSLTIGTPTAVIAADLHGDAVAGERQIGAGLAASGSSTLAGDIRKVQAGSLELPSAGLLRLQSIGANIVVSGATDSAADGTLTLNDTKLNAAGLAALSLQTSGSVTFAPASQLTLAPGGALNVDAGRKITFGGSVDVAGGTIGARTYGVALGSLFDQADDLPADGQLDGAAPLGLFDIVVGAGATLSARGRWVNDALVTNGLLSGPGHTSGGAISLIAAPRVAAILADGSGAVDLSGSVLLASGSLLDVSGGGYVAPGGAMSLSGRGGDVSLISETSYFQLEQAPTLPLNRLTSDLTTFPITAATDRNYAIVPDQITATVAIDGEIRGFGFKGGGTFALVTPDLKFGSSTGGGTEVPLDFLQRTGFGTLSLTAWNTAFVDNPFANGLAGSAALLATEQVQIRAGETLNLTQSILPSLLGPSATALLLAQQTGTDISRLAALTPTNQLGDFDNLPAHLVLGGLTELQLLGGTITGAPTASITTPKLYNAGQVRIAGGSILQSEVLPLSYVETAVNRAAVAVRQQLDADGVDRGAGLSVIFGTADAAGKFDEDAPNALELSANGQVLSNRDLLTKPGVDRQVYYLGLLDAGEGIVLADGSVINLAGASIRDPRATLLPDGSRPAATGRLIDGGSIRLAGLFVGAGQDLFSKPAFKQAPYGFVNQGGDFEPGGARAARTLVGQAGSAIDLSGAADLFDVQTGPASFTPTAVWSNAGTLSALGGGNVTAVTIDARGGSQRALGGTFEWANPILVESASANLQANVVSATQLEEAGFDRLIARASLTALGDVDLALGRSFQLLPHDYSGAPLVRVVPTIGERLPNADPYYAISIGSAGRLSIAAPHIGLLGIDQVAGAIGGTGGTGRVELRGGAIDISGAVAFDRSLASVTLDSATAIRLIGVQPLARTLTPDSATDEPSLSGQIVTTGDLLLRAGQVYATTGSGNLQRLIDTGGTALVRPFLIASAGADATIRFESQGAATPATPYSAGSYLSVQAPNIEQAGVLRAPLGRIDLGSSSAQRLVSSGLDIGRTERLTLAPGSITSVSAGNLAIHYGTTTDLTEYFFTPGATAPIAAPPAAELRLGGVNIAIDPAATVDGSGGGSLFATEFVPGTGGSRNVLSRFNSDLFSSTNGFQFADGREVYAIVPANSSNLAAIYDPIYSSENPGLYAGEVGKLVRLEGGSGIPAGDYLLLPGQFAVLPGAFRLVENVGAAAPLPGEAAALRDGSVIVAGSYGVAGTDLTESQRRSFTVQSQEVFSKFSRIELTDGAESFTELAERQETALPRLPVDAARIVINPLATLAIGAGFNTRAAAGGRGSQVDLAGEIIDIVSPGAAPRTGAITLITSEIDRLNAASLLIGGVRTDKSDGTTDVRITASEINVRNDLANPLRAPEIVLAVDGVGSVLNVADGASIVATGTLDDAREGDYNVAYFTRDALGNIVSDNSGAGSLVRLANGAERLVNRSGDLAASVTGRIVTLNIGQARLVGETMSIDTSRNLDFDAAADVDVRSLALSGDTISFSSRTFGLAGLVITPELEQTLAEAERLTIRANSTVGFTPGEHRFNDLTLDTPGIRLIGLVGTPSTAPQTVTIAARDVTLANSAADTGACRGNGSFACGSAGNSLILDAESLTFGSGVIRTYSFDNAVRLNARDGISYAGAATFDVGSADLRLTTPYIADLGSGDVPTASGRRSDLTLSTLGDVAISHGGAARTPVGPAAPGARLAIGAIAAPVASVSIDGALLRATAGVIDINAAADIAVSGASRLETPSYSQAFGDAADRVTVSAAGGTIGLTALGGDIDLGSATTLAIGGLSGAAGRLNLLASRGEVRLAGTIDAVAPGAGASLAIDSGLGALDLAALVSRYGAQFTGDVALRSGAGDLALLAGQTLRAKSVKLTADGGQALIAGRIDTSGINGGAIGLFGRDGVQLASSAVLDARATGYAETDTRRASAGDVMIGVGEAGAIGVAAGAAINLAATRPGNRLVSELRTDPRTSNQVTAYTFVEGDQGGTLTLRAPVIAEAGADTVNIDFAGSVAGARDVTVEGYRRYDLAAVGANPGFVGVSVDAAAGTATLDLAATATGKTNFLADLAPGSLVEFVQTFDIAAARPRLGSLSGLAGYHERPGVELAYSGDIVLASNWNLGAGNVDVSGALAAGLMRPSQLGPRPDGSPRYEVVPGREAELFQRFVDLTYRVGGRVDGEAGRLTLRAGGDLDIRGSITDGFFAFSDQTDPGYISYQLGGGDRTFSPALTVQCGAGGANPTGCGDVTEFALGNVISPRTSINLNLTALARGDEALNNGVAPYSAAANSAAATGLFADGSGDPIGSGQLFPLLANGQAVGSFSIQLVGGAGDTPSADPLHIDRASGGGVSVSGETSYAIAAGQRTSRFGGPLQLRYEDLAEASTSLISDNFVANLVEQTGLDRDTLETRTTRVQFGQGTAAASDFMRAAAAEFFADYPGQVQFLGPVNRPTGFSAPLALVIQFLESRDASGLALVDRFAAQVASGSFGYNPPQSLGTIDPPGNVARTRSLVRTGTGSIDVAAAADIDLRDGEARLRGAAGQNLGNTAGNAAQVGGAAIYTAGHIVVPEAVTARVSGTQTQLTIDPADYALTGAVRDPRWVPTAAGRLQTDPVYASGGGSISLTAGQDVLGRRDVWSEVFNGNVGVSFLRGDVEHRASNFTMVGAGDQRWRVGALGVAVGSSSLSPTFETNIRINPQLFGSGVAALGGGNVTVTAGRDISELTVALDTSVTTGDVGASFGQMVFGGGNLRIAAGRDVLGGRFDIASGVAEIDAGRDVGSSGPLILRPRSGRPADLQVENLAEIRLTDASVVLRAGNSLAIASISALGVDSFDASPNSTGGGIDFTIDQNALGYYSGRSAVSLSAGGDVSLGGVATQFTKLNEIAVSQRNFLGVVLPATLEVVSRTGDIDLGDLPAMLYPSATGQLSLLAAGTLQAATVSLDDGDPSLLPGIFSTLRIDTSQSVVSGRPFSLPVVLPNTSDTIRRLYHNSNPTHANDPVVARVAAGGDLIDLTLFISKPARVSAGGDIVNMMFSGQNLAPSDLTRIVAGRDITATTAIARGNTNSSEGRSLVQGNQFIIGGPGSLFVEAGRDLGPFLNSAIAPILDRQNQEQVAVGTFPGGIFALGNDYNPWLEPKSADLFVFFGVANGMRFDALRETYVNPANIGALDGDLFVQTADPNGNLIPDRTRPIYAPILIAWMQANYPAALTATFGTTAVTVEQAYQAFAALPALAQRKFLLGEVYFNELAAPSRPDGPSFLQYVRGYRAVDTLFPAELGYTANDLSGEGNGGERVITGNLDLRLAAIETTRNSGITILGPGGDAILGSVIRTSAQAARRAYQADLIEGVSGNVLRPLPTTFPVPVFDIPIGFEGALTLRGGKIQGFTDGDFRLNQSRLFSQQSGDITLWSSNGDLNAGQGPKSAANVQPIVVRFDPNGFAEVDSAGAVTGAGIAGFAAIRRLNPATGLFEIVDALNDSNVALAIAQLLGQPAGTQVQIGGRTYTRDAPSITLVAPAGTVDAGDAGVRASGDIFVAAARVANADNFKVGGSSVGIPAANVPAAPAAPASAASAVANVFRAVQGANEDDERVRILVDVLGLYSGSDEEECAEGSEDERCQAR